AGLVLGVVGEQVAHRVFGLRRPAGPNGTVDRQAGPGRRKRSKRRIALIASLVVLLLIAGGGIGMWLWANSVFNRIQRVPVSAELRRGGGQATNYLLVGTDNRPGVSGNRSDTIMVLRVQGGGARMLSIPRDLYVKIADTGRQQKINAAYNSGAANLIKTIKDNLGIPVDRYFEVNFVSFGGLVDAVGGVDINFANPAFDLNSGLDVKTSGLVHLNGAQALAYARSRHYTEVVNGQQRPQGGLPDINRQLRQQAFLRAVFGKAGKTRNPFKLMHIASSMTKGLRIDDKMTLWNAIQLGWDVGGFNPETVKLPVVPSRTSSGSDILQLQQPAAEAVISQFRT
ncbi:MAG: LCP family protein, partial [Actinomycetota bacterium]|nr:LCP family protein [Actinomycetota bacterium]